MITERWGFIQHISDYVLDHRDTLGLLNDEKGAFAKHLHEIFFKKGGEFSTLSRGMQE